jgi:hypothetical protein
MSLCCAISLLFVNSFQHCLTERSPLSLVSTNEKLLEKKSSHFDLENQDYGVEIRRADYAIPLFLQKLALTPLTSVGRSVGVVRSRTKATELLLFDLRTLNKHNCSVW